MAHYRVSLGRGVVILSDFRELSFGGPYVPFFSIFELDLFFNDLYISIHFNLFFDKSVCNSNISPLSLLQEYINLLSSTK